MRIIDSLDVIQKIELGILDYVVDICEKNNLRYYLAGGTLLGAIRHKGFIPWDNDIDISLPRTDYDKLMMLLENNNNQGQYKMLKFTEHGDYAFPYCKVVDNRTYVVEVFGWTHSDDFGVNIDIFPIDGLGNDKSNGIKLWKPIRIKCYGITLTAASYKNLSLYSKFKWVCFKILYGNSEREKCFENEIDKLRKNSFDNSMYVISTFGVRREKEVIEKECFAQSIDVKFEERYYKAPIGYDRYLKQMYGDYMELPPVDERIPNHDLEVYWRD
jgi:lipopolysaccharide cholinephosphotransferase